MSNSITFIRWNNLSPYIQNHWIEIGSKLSSLPLSGFNTFSLYDGDLTRAKIAGGCWSHPIHRARSFKASLWTILDDEECDRRGLIQ